MQDTSVEVAKETAQGVVVVGGVELAAKGAQIGYRAYRLERTFDTPVKELTKQQEKSIRSYEKLIKEHEQKIKEFKENLPVRPGMEKMPKEKIEAQQQRRIYLKEKEIAKFRENIEKIKRGEIDS